jgi:hypothetical protein
MFTVAATLQEVLELQSGCDRKALEYAATVEASHPNSPLNLSLRIPGAKETKLVHSQVGEKCPDCKCFTFATRNPSTGGVIWACLDSIKAVRYLSLTHRDTTWICLRCEITFDSLGLVSGRNCLQSIRRADLPALIAAGRVWIDKDLGIGEIR